MAVTLALAKQQLRLDSNEEDALITAYLRAAVGKIENYIGKKLERGTVTDYADNFASIVLKFGPNPAELALEYTDADGQPQTITDAVIAWPHVTRSNGWPAIAQGTQIKITYKAGYTDTPPELDLAVLLLVGESQENREAGNGSDALSPSIEGLCLEHRAVLV